MPKLPDRHALSLRLMPEAYQKLDIISKATGLKMTQIINQLIIKAEVDTTNVEQIIQKTSQLKDLEDQVKALKAELLNNQNKQLIIKE
jgi:predicted DNA-binding protein